MTPQQFVVLDYVRRAPDQTVSYSEREDLVESLGYTLGLENEFPDWLFESLLSTEGMLPDSMVLWLCDFCEGYVEQFKDTDRVYLFARLWKNTSGSVAKKRVFETVLNIESNSSRQRVASETVAAQLVTSESYNLIEEHNLNGFLSLLDLILINDSPELFDFAIQERHRLSDSMQNATRNHLRERFTLMSLRAQVIVQKYFEPGNL